MKAKKRPLLKQSKQNRKRSGGSVQRVVQPPPERIKHLLDVIRIRLQRIELTVKEPAESVLREAMEMRAVISTLEKELLGG